MSLGTRRSPATYVLWLSSLLLMLVSLEVAQSLMLTIESMSTECIMVEIFDWQEEIDGSYEVFGGGSMKVEVLSPASEVIHSEAGSSGKWLLPTREAGVYSLCFHHTASGAAPKIVGFTFHGHDSDLDAPANNKNVAKIEMVSKLQHMLYQLSDSVDTLKDRQNYLKTRQAVHATTAESTRERVMWWSLAEAVVLVAVGAYQTYTIVSTFEVKRKI